jgi:exonuclease III
MNSKVLMQQELWNTEQMRIATWNIKQAVAPKKPLDELWLWAANYVKAEVMVFTEAKVPKGGVPSGWTAVWDPNGIGERRRWGTVIAARGLDLIDVSDGASGRNGFSVSHTWPGTVKIVDVVRKGKVLMTVAGVYGITVDLAGNSIGSGHVSVPVILDGLRDLMKSPRGKNLVIAGDFNLWPSHMPEVLYRKMVDVVEETFDDRQLVGCTGCSSDVSPCGHMWTHKNGNKPGAKVQNLDYIFASPKVAKNIVAVTGGVADFPKAWDLSDHAPVVVDLDI